MVGPAGCFLTGCQTWHRFFNFKSIAISRERWQILLVSSLMGQTTGIFGNPDISRGFKFTRYTQTRRYTVLFESPITSVSAVSSGHSPLSILSDQTTWSQYRTDYMVYNQYFGSAGSFRVERKVLKDELTYTRKCLAVYVAYILIK